MADPALQQEQIRRRLLGWSVACEPILPGVDLGRDLVLASDGGSARPRAGRGDRRLGQSLSLALTTALGSDVFNTAFGFDGLNALAEEPDPTLARERVRISVIKVLHGRSAGPPDRRRRLRRRRARAADGRAPCAGRRRSRSRPSPSTRRASTSEGWCQVPDDTATQRRHRRRPGGRRRRRARPPARRSSASPTRASSRSRSRGCSPRSSRWHARCSATTSTSAPARSCASCSRSRRSRTRAPGRRSGRSTTTRSCARRPARR